MGNNHRYGYLVTDTRTLIDEQNRFKTVEQIDAETRAELTRRLQGDFWKDNMAEAYKLKEKEK